jgi:hypothetical protein
LVYCWTHVRRRFVKRFENEGSPIAEEMQRQIALLYQLEKSVRGQDAAVRLAARREHADPVITALKPWLEAHLSRIPQKSQLAEDIRYTLGHWPGLIRFLNDGTLEMDTNPVENQIHPICAFRGDPVTDSGVSGHPFGGVDLTLLGSPVAGSGMTDRMLSEQLTGCLGRRKVDGGCGKVGRAGNRSSDDRWQSRGALKPTGIAVTSQYTLVPCSGPQTRPDHGIKISRQQ